MTSGQSFTPWSQLVPNTISSGPEAVIDDAGPVRDIYLFVRGTDDHIYSIRRSGGVWGSFSEISAGGFTNQSPSAVLSTSTIDLYVKGRTDNNVYVTSSRDKGATWISWQKLAGDHATPSGPEAVLEGGGKRLFIRGTDNRIYANDNPLPIPSSPEPPIQPSFDFNLSLSSFSINVVQGDSRSITLTATLSPNSRSAGQAVSFSVPNIPRSDIGVTFDPPSCIPIASCTSTIRITTQQQTPVSSYIIRVLAQGGGTSKKVDINLNVTPRVQKVIKVTAPNGGEVWSKGQRHDIEWSWPELTSFSLFYVDLVSKDAPFTLVRNIGTEPAPRFFSDHYQWIIPFDIPDGQYRIRVTGDGGISDVSDAAFSIIGQPSGGVPYKIGLIYVYHDADTYNSSWKSQFGGIAQKLRDALAEISENKLAPEVELIGELKTDRYSWNPSRTGFQVKTHVREVVSPGTPNERVRLDTVADTTLQERIPGSSFTYQGLSFPGEVIKVFRDSATGEVVRRSEITSREDVTLFPSCTRCNITEVDKTEKHQREFPQEGFEKYVARSVSYDTGNKLFPDARVDILESEARQKLSTFNPLNYDAVFYVYGRFTQLLPYDTESLRTLCGSVFPVIGGWSSLVLGENAVTKIGFVDCSQIGFGDRGFYLTTGWHALLHEILHTFGACDAYQTGTHFGLQTCRAEAAAIDARIDESVMGDNKKPCMRSFTCTESQLNEVYLDSYNRNLLREKFASYGRIFTIDGQGLSSLEPTSATVTWSTSMRSTSQVAYGLTKNYDRFTQEDLDLVKIHSQVLTGLTPNTLYEYKVISRDGQGKVMSRENNFRTPSIQSSIISLSPLPQQQLTSPPAQQRTLTTPLPASQDPCAGATGQIADLCRQLAELRALLESLQRGATTPSSSQQQQQTSAPPVAGSLFRPDDRVETVVNTLNIRSSPSISSTRIGGLTRGNQGRIAVPPRGFSNPASADGYTWWYIDWDSPSLPTGWSVEGISESTFLESVAGATSLQLPSPFQQQQQQTITIPSAQQQTTLPPSSQQQGEEFLRISNNAAVNITQNSATITWTTDKPATSVITYGATGNYGSFTPEDTNLILTHSQTITGLTPNTFYYYRAMSRTSSNLTAYAEGFFRTAAESGTPPTTISPSSQQQTTTATASPPPSTQQQTTPFDFSLSNSGNVSITKGSTAANNISVTLLSGAGQEVTLSASISADSGVSYSITGCTPPCSATLNLTASDSPYSITGTYPVTVTGTAGGVTKTTSFNLTLNAAVSPPPSQQQTITSPQSPPSSTTSTTCGSSYKSNSGNLTVLCPNGGEVIPAGSTYTIRWRPENPGVVGTTRIWLHERQSATSATGANIMQITGSATTNSSGESTYSWTVPTSLAGTGSTQGGNNLRIIVDLGFINGVGFTWDESDANFTISGLASKTSNDGLASNRQSDSAHNAFASLSVGIGTISLLLQQLVANLK
jgi:hypothetical protein